MKVLFNLILCLLLTIKVFSQNHASLREYENTFLTNNLLLIAEQFNIDAAKAAIIQAKIWEQPFFTADLNAINPEDRKIFNVGAGGQKAFSVQQLIYLGGKKKKEVEFARANAALAEIAFKDVLRNLRYQLRTTFFDVYFNKVSSASFQKQLDNLDTVVQNYSAQAKKGNVPLKDVVRLQALYLGLRNEQTELLNNIAEAENKLNVFTASLNVLTPNPEAKELAEYQKQLSFSAEGLQQQAITNRADFLMTDKLIEAAKINLQWQKSLGVPDVTVGAGYDQRSGAFNNQVNVTVGLPLKLWNRNQGNIKMADIRVSQATTEREHLLLQVKSEVNTAFEKYVIAKKNADMLNNEMSKNFEDVYRGVYQNFIKRNMSLIEFTDFMESYNQSIIHFNQIKKSLVRACEEINYATGTTLF